MIINTEGNFLLLLQQLSYCAEVVVDLETSGLNPWKSDQMCGIGLHLDIDNCTYYLPFRHQKALDDEHPLFDLLNLMEEDYQNLPLEFLPILLDHLSGIPKLIGHNIKFDLAFLHKDGFVLGEYQELEDTIVAGRLYVAGRHPDLSLEGLTKQLLGEDQSSYKKEFSEYVKKVWKKKYNDSPADKVGPYCESDCLTTRKIRDKLVAFIEETGQTKVWNQECKLLKVLWEMEKTGFSFDDEYCRDRIPKLEARMLQIQQQIYRMCGGFEFNVGSVDQVNKAFEKVGIKPLSMTAPSTRFPAGKPQWSVTELMSVQHPMGGAILEYRALQKLKTTYFDPLLEYPDHTIHCSFRSAGTATGRMSCTSPNVQNISKASQNLLGNEASDEVLDALKAFVGARKGQTVDMVAQGSGGIAGGINLGGMLSLTEKYEDTDLTVAVRRLYVPRGGFHLYMIDVSQMEMRVFADYVNDEHLTALLEDPNFDFHSHVAKEVWHLDETHELWKFYRTLAKAINFGLIYGIGVKKLATQIQKSVEEAESYRVQYFERFPKAEAFIQQVNRTIINRGYIFNRFKRRYVIEPEKAYIGVNYLVQGTSADIIKAAMINIDKMLKSHQAKTRMLIQVHDELILEVAYDEEKQIVPEIQKTMEIRQIASYLPTEVSKGFPSWAQKKKMCTGCMEVEEKNHQCVKEMS